MIDVANTSVIPKKIIIVHEMLHTMGIEKNPNIYSLQFITHNESYQLSFHVS